MKQSRVTISLKLKPGARNDSIEVKDGGTIQASVTSPAVEGRANEHLIRLLSRALRISKSSCSIIQGAKSRFKVIAIEGIGREQLIHALKNNVLK